MCLQDKQGDFKEIILCLGLSFLNDHIGFSDPMSSQGVTGLLIFHLNVPYCGGFQQIANYWKQSSFMKTLIEL